jgi:hypothetical protein
MRFFGEDTEYLNTAYMSFAPERFKEYCLKKSAVMRDQLVYFVISGGDVMVAYPRFDFWH